MQIILRNIVLADLDDYYYWLLPDKKSHDFNGPYFERATAEELREMVLKIKKKLVQNEPPFNNQRRIIASKTTNEIIGTVNWYWKSQETLWMEIGILIFNEKFWNKGIGYEALSLWIDELFYTHPEIIRLGLSTWSGNYGMIRLAQKLHFQEEACYRKARIVDGNYYDSISYGILRPEWEANRMV